MYYITNHKIIRTKHGEYITVITKDYDMINLNIDKNIESYDNSYNLTKNISIFWMRYLNIFKFVSFCSFIYLKGEFTCACLSDYLSKNHCD